MLFIKAVLFAALFMICYCEDNAKKVVEVEKLLRYINSNAATARQKAKSGGGSSYPHGQSISLSGKSYGGGSNAAKSYGSAPSAPSVYTYNSGSDSSLSGSISSYQQPSIQPPSPSVGSSQNYGSSSGSSSYPSSGSNSKPSSKPKVEYDDPYGYNYYGVNMGGQDDRLSNNFFGGPSNQLGGVQPVGSGQVFCQDMQPIFEGEIVTEQYCRCSDGSYGYTCTEGFGNPCLFGSSQFFPADPRLPRNYFIHCSWTIPYLKKCAAMLLWNQDLLTCAWA